MEKRENQNSKIKTSTQSSKTNSKSTKNKNISEREEKIILTEYQEICNYHRQLDNLKWSIARIFIPLSISAFPLVVKYPEMKLSLGLASLLIYWFWWVIYFRLGKFTNLRLERADEIEQLLSMNHHLRFKPSNHGIEFFVRLYGYLFTAAWVIFLVNNIADTLMGWFFG